MPLMPALHITNGCTCTIPINSQRCRINRITVHGIYNHAGQAHYMPSVTRYSLNVIRSSHAYAGLVQSVETVQHLASLYILILLVFLKHNKPKNLCLSFFFTLQQKASAEHGFFLFHCFHFCVELPHSFCSWK